MWECGDDDGIVAYSMRHRSDFVAKAGRVATSSLLFLSFISSWLDIQSVFDHMEEGEEEEKKSFFLEQMPHF